MDNRLKPSAYTPSKAARNRQDSPFPSSSASALSAVSTPAPAPGQASASSSRPASGLAPSRPAPPSRSGLGPPTHPVLTSSSRSVSSPAPSSRPMPGPASFSRSVPGLVPSRPVYGLAPDVAVNPVPNVVVEPASDSAWSVTDGPDPDPARDATDNLVRDPVAWVVTDDPTPDEACSTDDPVPDEVLDTTAPGQAADAADNPAPEQAAHAVDSPPPDQAADAVDNPAPDQASSVAGDPALDRGFDAAVGPAPEETPAVENDQVPNSTPNPNQAPDVEANQSPNPAQDVAAAATPDPAALETTVAATAPPRGLEPTPVPEIDAATHIVVEHLRSGTVKTHVYSSKDGQPSLLGHVDPESIIDTISTTLDERLQDLNTLIRSSLEATKRESLDNTEALRAALEQNESNVANQVSLATNRNIEDQIKSEIVPRLDRIEALLTPGSGSDSSQDNNARTDKPLDKGIGRATRSVKSSSDAPQSEDEDRGSNTSMEPMDPSVIEESNETPQDQETVASTSAEAKAAQTLEPPGNAQPVILEKLTAMETQVDALYKVVVEGQIPQNTAIPRDNDGDANGPDQTDQEAFVKLIAMQSEILDFPETWKETILKIQKLVESLEASPATAAAREVAPKTVPQGPSDNIEGAEAPHTTDHENQATLEQWQAEYDEMMAVLSEGLENRDLEFETLDTTLKNMETKFKHLEGVNKLNLRASLRYMHMVYKRVDTTDARVHTALGDIHSLAEIAPERCTQIAFEMSEMRNEVLSTLARLPDTIVNHLIEASQVANASVEEAQADDPAAESSTGLGDRTRGVFGAWASRLSARTGFGGGAPTSDVDAQSDVVARAGPEESREAQEPSPTESDLERRVDFIEQHLHYNPNRAAVGRGGSPSLRSAVASAIPDGVPASGSVPGEHAQRGLAPDADIAQELDVIQRGIMSLSDRQITLQHGTERILELIENQERAEERTRPLDHEAALPHLLDTTEGLIKEFAELKTSSGSLEDKVVDCHNDVRNLLQGSMHDSDLLSAIKTHFEGSSEAKILTGELLKKASDTFDMVEDIKAMRAGTLSHQEAIAKKLEELQKKQDQGIQALIQKQDYSWLALNDKQEKYHEAHLSALERCNCRCRTNEHAPIAEEWSRSAPDDDVLNENPFADIPQSSRSRGQQAGNIGDEGCSNCGLYGFGDNTTEGAAETIALRRELEQCRAQQVMLAEEVKEADHTVGKLMVTVMDKDQDINNLKAAIDETRQDFERQQLVRDQENYNLNTKLEKKKQELKEMKTNMEWWLLEGLGLKPDAIAEASGSRLAGAAHLAHNSNEPGNYGDDDNNNNNNNNNNTNDSDQGLNLTREGKSQRLPRHILMTEAAAELRQTLEEHRMQIPGLLAEIRELEERKGALVQQVAQLEYQHQVHTEAQAHDGEPSRQPNPAPTVDAEGEEDVDNSEPWPQRTGRERLQTLRRNRNLSQSRQRGQSCHRSQSRGPSGLNPNRGGGERVPQLEVDVRVCKDGDISETLFSNKAVLTQEQFDRVRSRRNEEQDDEVWSMFCDIKVKMVPFPPAFSE